MTLDDAIDGKIAHTQLNRTWSWMIADIEVESDKAIKITTDAGQAWIPRAMLKAYQGELAAGNTLRVAIPEWMARDKGLV